MATATVIQSLTPHLNASQARELPGLQQRFQDSRVLLKELHRRGWLTAYQAQQLSQGRGGELILGGYRILDRLGEGAAGQVFKALRVQQNQLVALKVLKKEVQADAEMAGRFRREIEAVSQVAHPNIVKALEAGTADGQLFLAMEYVEGVDLARLVKESGRLPAATACDYIRQAALALQHIHERGLVHRDIKPANFLLSGGNQVKLLDLGLARVLQPKADSTTSNLTMLAGSSVTIGTPDYLAPEQAIDLRSADIRADIYSLGCTFFYLLTGQPPFGGGSFAEKLMRHHQAEPPRLSKLKPGLPPALDDIIQRMLAKRPADRYQTPGEVARALTNLAAARAEPAQRRRMPRAILVALPLLLLGVTGWFLWPPGAVESTTPTRAMAESTTPIRATAATPIAPLATGGRTITLQGRKLVNDTLIDPSKPEVSHGGVPRDNQLTRSNQSTVFLVRFGLENAGLPAGARVEQAILSFYVWDPHNLHVAKTAAFPLLIGWREDQATWNRPQAGQAWKGGGGFALAQDAGPALGHCVVRRDQGGDTADPPIEYQIDVTPIAREWLRDPAANHGLAIAPVPDRAIDGGHASRFQIYAVEHNRLAFTPKLTLRVAE